MGHPDTVPNLRAMAEQVPARPVAVPACFRTGPPGGTPGSTAGRMPAATGAVRLPARFDKMPNCF